jgi:predicted metal-binding protein
LKATGGTTRLISTEISEEIVKADLERYKQKAIELGAAQAEIIPAQWVQVDERVRLKCLIPRCFNYGQCAYCPPDTPEPEFMRQAFSRFHWALLFRSDVVPIEDYADINRYSPNGAKHGRQSREIIGAVEVMAFADGYYLAMGFGSGSCRDSLCGTMLCQVLDSGRCRFPLKARPSMEAVGIDVYGLAAKVGWQIYPIYNGVDPEQVPCASTVGVVFIH